MIQLLSVLLMVGFPFKVFSWSTNFTVALQTNTVDGNDIAIIASYAVKSLVIIVSTYLLIISGKSFSLNNYFDGVKKFLCAIVVGISPHLVSVFWF